MAFSNNIFIFSGDTGSGKTTLLNKWATNTTNIGGILSPEINGKRYFHNINSGEKRPLESSDGNLKVGRFTFDEDAFLWATESLLEQFQSGYDWLIIDEIGPLELKQKKGFHLLIQQLQNKASSNTRLLFIVRATLVDEFIHTYSIQHVKIIPRTYFEGNSLPDLKGIVLCGGESSRMKSDKALLQYTDLPQWKVMNRMLERFCDQVLISVNKHQRDRWCNHANFNLHEDKDKFGGKGPLTGILSCLEDSDQGCFIAAVDYPLLKTEHLVALCNARDTKSEAVCFTVEGRTEPLVSILESAAVAKLRKFAAEGGNSLNKFMSQIATAKMELPDMGFMLNINTQQEMSKLNSYMTDDNLLSENK